MVLLFSEDTMSIPKEYKKYLFQTVHCSGYIKQNKHWDYYLKKINERWYSYNSKRKEYYARVSTDPRTWIWHANYEVFEKDFSGVVIKIYSTAISSTLGITENIDSDFPKKENGLVLMVCDVCFRNGGKRIVPFELIKEHEAFDCGDKILKHYKNIKESFFKETETFLKESGEVAVKTKINFINQETLELDNYNQTAIFDIIHNKVKIPGYGQPIFIDDNAFQTAKELLENQAKEKTGCNLKVNWGFDNFEKLRSFTRFPYAPLLNFFHFLFTEPETQILEDKLKNAPDCIRQFIEICGIKYSPKLNKLLLDGPEYFAQYMGILNSGFTEENAVDLLLDGDESLSFAKFFMESFKFIKNEYLERNYYFEDDPSIETPETQLLVRLQDPVNTKFIMTRGEVPEFIQDVFFIRSLYDQKKAAKLIVQLTNKEDPSTKDIVEYMRILKQENLLNLKMIKKIGNEGFTEYTHNQLCGIYNEIMERRLQIEESEQAYQNLSIQYSDDEKKLEWDYSGYKFSLPENTDRLLDIGNSMNICVGHLYREKAVNKECTIVYATKNNDYVLCIEVQKVGNQFFLIQKSAFGNAKPKGEDLSVFNRWRRTKMIKTKKL